MQYLRLHGYQTRIGMLEAAIYHLVRRQELIACGGRLLRFDHQGPLDVPGFVTPPQNHSEL
jgi:hypothetical protein